MYRKLMAYDDMRSHICSASWDKKGVNLDLKNDYIQIFLAIGKEISKCQNIIKQYQKTW